MTKNNLKNILLKKLSEDKNMDMFHVFGESMYMFIKNLGNNDKMFSKYFEIYGDCLRKISQENEIPIRYISNEDKLDIIESVYREFSEECMYLYICLAS